MNCTYCKTIAGLLGPVVRANKTAKVVEEVITWGCEVLKADCHGATECKELCSDIVGQFGFEVLRVFTIPEVACAALKYCPKPAPPPPPPADAPVPVPSDLSDTAGEHAWPAWSKTTGTANFLHLTDIHLDLGYTPGNQVQCGLPLCCRNDSGTAGGNASNAAGYWGDLRTGKGSGCDTPLHTLQSAVAAIAANAKSGKLPLDFVIYTGDSPAHYVWETSPAGNVKVIDLIAAELNAAFPDVPVISAVGNHESSPVNQFAGPGKDAWLYDALAAAWAHSLPDQALRTLRFGGYFAARARPGLFVVSLNLNLFQVGADVWLLANNTDLASQLPWLRDTLRQVRELKAKAILIGHEPGMSEPYQTYFNAIVDEYADVIMDQFRGHTHTEDVCVVRDSTTGTPLHSMYIAGSITTYSFQNSGYQVYEFDRALPRPRLVDNFQQFWLDIEAANANNDTSAWSTPRMDARTQYKMADLTPASWVDLSGRMRNDTALFHSWVANRYKGIGGSQDDLNEDACFLASCSSNDFDKCTHRAGAFVERVGHGC